MRLRNIPGAKEVVRASDLVWDEIAALSQRGHWQQVFPVVQPLHLEIGMGRGLFLSTLSQSYPDINFLGLELREEMVMQTIQRLEDDLPPANLRFLWLNASRLDELFAPGEVDHIYINFPDPWPKSRHAKRRLTAQPMLKVYRNILAPRGQLEFKTDNAALFDWSLENFLQTGWVVESVTHNLPLEQTKAVTEYERRYRNCGVPICSLTARKG